MLRIPLLEDSLFEVIRLNARFANTLGRVTAEFLRDVASTLNESPLIDFDGAPRQRTSRPGRYQPRAPEAPPPAYAASTAYAAPHAHTAPPAYAPAAAPAQPAPAPQSVMLLEAEAGSAAIGFFLV